MAYNKHAIDSIIIIIIMIILCCNITTYIILYNESKCINLYKKSVHGMSLSLLYATENAALIHNKIFTI